MPHCPLCAENSLREFHQDRKRTYLQCLTCELVSVPAEYYLTAEDEKAQYDQHQNSPDDPGYRKFLSRTFEPLVSRIQGGSVGLDFGCGPGPTICVMAKARGIVVKNYDLYYSNDLDLLKQQYDFITMTEVIEHISDPRSVFEQLDSMLKPAGILAIMTKRVISRQTFRNWHYKNDPTHICFYSLKTFEWLGNKLGWQMEIIDADVVFFRK